jgi:gamma-glutamylcyclotransferase (GGCT)/AIG2-like uncharacterized protein YtfP
MAGRTVQVPAARGGLFAYGTLQFPEVLAALLDRVPDGVPGTAPGWRAARLRGRSYPGLAPGRGHAPGVLLTGLSELEWRILDGYEDEEYDLVAVELSGPVQALAYRYHKLELVLAEDWSATEFADRQLAAFVGQCRCWRMAQDF